MQKNTKERCPKCASIHKDTRGDNLHVYPDGSSYCFACGFSSRGNRIRSKDRDETVGEREVVIPRDAGVIPDAFSQWWNRYLPGEDIRKWAYYSGENQRLIFLLPMGGWIGRSLDSVPKWLQAGSKQPLFIGTGEVVVLCEDIISGIKLSFLVSSCVLFGTNISILDRRCYDILRTKDVVVWLDSDMRKKMLEISSILSLSGVRTRIVYSDKDIKEYSYKDIALFLTERY